MSIYVYQSTGVGNTWSGEPVLATIIAYDKPPAMVGLDLETIKGGTIAQLKIQAGEALLWADRLRRAAEIAIASCEISEEDYRALDE